MKNKAILITGILFTLFFGLFPIKTYAADLTITCDENNCTSSGATLFNHTNISPGFSVEKIVRVENLNADSSCDLQLQAERQERKANPDLGEKLSTVITRDQDTIFGDKNKTNSKTIADLFGEKIFWGTVTPNSSAEYVWKTSFDSDSGNKYQRSHTSFNFSLNFSCATPSGSNESEVLGSRAEVKSRSSKFIARVLGNTKQEQITEETEQTTDRIVTKLKTNSKVNSKDTAGNILGTECENSFPWWIIIFLQVSLGLITIIAFKLWESIRRVWFFPIVSGIAFQITHYLIGCNCTTDYWCPKYIFINLALTLATLSIGYYIKRTGKPSGFPENLP